ncbi:hypothetical protein FQN60_004083 [Etheostoma spectabile]|uniref:Uncharacterized protein n=1 Tax=Etheostoma spectabile TaxID=54343 RepID=A0A5J5CW63_9PERO|nr:hypothetical protein FQN60_004083 [Etheostoma spectabile]
MDGVTDALVSHMALGTEAPSTGSQREPSRLEQNTNQRLTGHSHSPHQRSGRTPAPFTPPCSTFYFTHELQQIHREWMMGNRLQTWSRIKACGGLECDCHAFTSHHLSLNAEAGLTDRQVRVIDRRAVAVKAAECHGMPGGGSGRKKKD